VKFLSNFHFLPFFQPTKPETGNCKPVQNWARAENRSPVSSFLFWMVNPRHKTLDTKHYRTANLPRSPALLFSFRERKWALWGGHPNHHQYVFGVYFSQKGTFDYEPKKKFWVYCPGFCKWDFIRSVFILLRTLTRYSV